MMEKNLLTGIQNVPLSISWSSKGGHFEFFGSASLYVNIPSSRKMANFGSLQGILTSPVEKIDLEHLPERFAREAIRIPDTKGSSAFVEGSIILREGKGGLKILTVSSSFTIGREPEFTLSVQREGLTACPCSMGEMRTRLEKMHPLLKNYPDIPVITHSQRSRITVSIKAEKTVSYLNLLSEIGEEAFGNTLSFTGSNDQINEMLLRSHQNPLLVEDVSRRAISLAKEKIKDPGPLKEFKVECTSFESIHAYNAYSKKILVYSDQS